MALLTCTICDKDLCLPSEAGQEETNDTNDIPTAETDNSNLPSSSRGRSKQVNKKATFARRKTALSATAIPTDIICSPCGHLFHTKCLQIHISSHKNQKCPKCSKSIPSTKIIKLFPTIGRVEVGRIASPDPVDGLTVKQPRISVMDRLMTFNPQPYEGDSYSELKESHTNLITDYEELQHNVNEQKDALLIQDATLSSLQDLKNILKQELEELRVLQPDSNKKITRKRKLGPAT